MRQGAGRTSRVPHRVVLVVDHGSNPFEIGCACEIFGARRIDDLGFEPYTLTLVTPDGEAVLRDSLFRLSAGGTLADLTHADTVIVPNRPDVATASRPELLGAIRAAHARGVRLVGLCTGAFTLAEAGVLDGRPAAVHWQLADEFRRRFPAVRTNPDVLFVDDGDVLTSAGSAAALDLGLHIVRTDHGAEVAGQFSRRLVFAPVRRGDQRQFVEVPVARASDRSLAPLLDWASGHLDEDLSVADLASRAHISVTTLHRRFLRETGSTPLVWLTQARVELARRLLEVGDDGVETIARRCGLGTAANLRIQIRRQTGLSPSQYRAAHSSIRPEPPSAG